MVLPPPQPQPEPPQPPVVPPTLKEPSDSEKQSYTQNRSAMEIKPSDTELLPGWKPFANAKSGAEIIQKAMQDGSYKNLLKPGDYITGSVTTGNYTTYSNEWHISEFDHYGYNEALMVPKYATNEGFRYLSKSEYEVVSYSESDVAKACDEFYSNMPDTLKPYVKAITVPISDGSINAYVFPPSVIEAFGTDYKSSYNDKGLLGYSNNLSRYVAENSEIFRQYEYFATNIKYGAWWLRHSAINHIDTRAFTSWNGDLYDSKYNGLGQNSTESQVSLLPCFCIY